MPETLVDLTSGEQAAQLVDELRRARRYVDLGYAVLGGDHPFPHSGKNYDIVPARDTSLEDIPTPAGEFRALDLDLSAFFAGNLPDIFQANEGLLKIALDTRNPQDLSETQPIVFSTNFNVRDQNYAPTFLYRGVMRNVVFRDFVNLFVNLYEMDEDPSAYYDKIKGIVEGVPELKSLDVLNGIPYLNVAAKLFDGIIKTFGKNPDDHLWSEIPELQITPTPGGAFLRSGVYVLFQPVAGVGYGSFYYRDGKVQIADGSPLPSTHLIFGVAVKEQPKT